MLGIIGLILKIILWIILGILGLVILLLNIVLWVPIRYRVHVSKPADGELSVKGRVTWILWLIRIYFEYHKDVTYKAKLLFFTVADSENDKNDNASVEGDERDTNQVDSNGLKNEFANKVEAGRDDSNKDAEENLDKNQSKNITHENLDNDRIINKESSSSEINLKNTSMEVSKKDEAQITTANQNQVVATKTVKEEDMDGLSESIEHSFLKGDDQDDDDQLVENKDNLDSEHTETKKVKKKKDKESKAKKDKSPLDGIKAAYEKYSPLWKDEKYQGVFKFVLSNVLKMLKSILPKKLRADVTFGLDDPATTGYIVGAISMFYGVVGDIIKVTPDFQEKGFEGEIIAKGRVFLGVLLYYVIRTYLDKRVRAVIKMFR